MDYTGFVGYGISAVRYDNRNPNFVSMVRQHKISFSNVDIVGELALRSDVINNIMVGDIYRIIATNDGHNWNLGSIVGIVRAAGENFIRADAQPSPGDYLGNLPQC